MNRRHILKSTGAATAGLIAAPHLSFGKQKKSSAKFKYCLNTSTIRGQKPGVEKYVDIAARAGYDALEMWIPDLKEYVSQGKTLKGLKKILNDSKVTVEDAIAFSAGWWMMNNNARRVLNR